LRRLMAHVEGRQVAAATLVADDLPAGAEIVALSVGEALSELYAATVDLATEDPDVDLAALLGKPVGVRLDPGTDGEDGAGAPFVVHGQRRPST
jgi:uncharacterized protein involved in type VI secretion and phage assembly